MKVQPFLSHVLNVISNSQYNFDFSFVLFLLSTDFTRMIYQPIPNIYSPPIGHFNYVLPLYQFEIDMIGKIIGKNGYYFKSITQKMGMSYIWFNEKTNCIELWSHDWINIINCIGYMLFHINGKTVPTKSSLHF